MKTYILLIILVALQLTSLAYDLTITGVVNDKSTSLPIANQPVEIIIDSTQQGSISYFNIVYTNMDGYYYDTISLPDSTTGFAYVSTDSCYHMASRISYFSPNFDYINNNFLICENNSGNDCEAFFTYYPSGEPFSIQFIDQSFGIIDSWSWDFGDGTYSNESNPIHTYPYPGEFIATLNIASDSCTSGFQMLVIVTQDTNFNCEAYYNYNLSTEPLTIEFYDDSYGSVSNWNWDFGDGEISYEQNPTHTYNMPGYYYVTLTIETIDSCTSYYGESIWVDGDSTQCQADFTVQLDTLNNTPNTFIFNDLSTGNIDSWYWEFGDGTYSTEPNPVHTYNFEGDYLVQLTITSFSGGTTCSSTEYQVARTMEYYNFGGQVFIGDYPINIDSNNSENHATIYLYRRVSNTWEYMDEMEFWKYGYYWFANKPTGDYLLLTELSESSIDYGNYAPSYYPQNINWQNANTFKLEDDQQFAVNIQLKELYEFESGIGRISGNISKGESCDTNNNIITENVMIQLSNTNNQLIAYTYTDEIGYYEFDGLGMDSYKVHAEYPGRYSESDITTLVNTEPNITLNLEIHCSHILDINEYSNDFSIDISAPVPNPTSNHFTLDITSIEQSEIRVEIINTNGSIISSNSYTIISGEQRITIPVMNILPGYYMVKIHELTTDLVTVKKIIVIR